MPTLATHGALGHIDWAVAGAFALGAVPASAASGRLAHHVTATTLRQGFGWFLVACGIAFVVYRLIGTEHPRSRRRPLSAADHQDSGEARRVPPGTPFPAPRRSGRVAAGPSPLTGGGQEHDAGLVTRGDGSEDGLMDVDEIIAGLSRSERDELRHRLAEEPAEDQERDLDERVARLEQLLGARAGGRSRGPGYGHGPGWGHGGHAHRHCPCCDW